MRKLFLAPFGKLNASAVTLDPIKFNVTSGLYGLQGLQGLVSIDQPDVVGGTTDGINLNINGAHHEYLHDARALSLTLL